MKKLAYGFVLAFAALCSAIALATDYSDDNFVGDIAPSQVIPLFGGVRKVYVFTDTSGLATLEVKRVLTLEKLLVVGGGGGGGGHIGGDARGGRDARPGGVCASADCGADGVHRHCRGLPDWRGGGLVRVARHGWPLAGDAAPFRGSVGGSH